MLVLSRKRDEFVRIIVPPSEVERVILAQVVEIRSDKTRIGFEAERDITVHREEVFQAIQRGSARKVVDNEQKRDIP